jgi:heme O synthase-like polyprenyltransferase
MRAVVFVAVYTLVALVGVAVIVRVLAGRIGRVTSWYRTPWHNTEVGGLAGSLHLLGWAADITPVTGETEELARQTFPVVVNEGDHIHVSLFRA